MRNNALILRSSTKSLATAMNLYKSQQTTCMICIKTGGKQDKYLLVLMFDLLKQQEAATEVSTVSTDRTSSKYLHDATITLLC